nr:alpha-1,2-fucosyltransferase [Haloferula luteola]
MGEYAKFFDGSSDFDPRNPITRWRRLWYRIVSRHRNWRIFRRYLVLEGHRERPLILDHPSINGLLEGKEVVILRGYWVYTSKSLLRENADVIRKYFSFEEAIREPVNRRFQDLRTNPSTVLIGVHIRRTDYKEFANGAFYFDVEEYHRVMKSVVESNPTVAIEFLVFSDETRSVGEFNQVHCHCLNFGFLGDLYALSQCDALIGPWSSFNRWAAFFGDIPRLEMGRDLRSFDLSDFDSEVGLNEANEKWEILGLAS